MASRVIKKVTDQRRKPFILCVQWQYATQRAMMTYAIWPKPNHCSGAMRTFVRASNVESLEWRHRRGAIEKVVGQEVLVKREKRRK